MARPPTLSKEFKEIYDLAINQGWQVEQHAGTSLRWTSPDKSQTPVMSAAQAGGRGFYNFRASLVRAGLDVSSLKPAKPKKENTIEVIIEERPAFDFSVDSTREQVAEALADRFGMTLEEAWEKKYDEVHLLMFNLLQPARVIFGTGVFEIALVIDMMASGGRLRRAAGVADNMSTLLEVDPVQQDTTGIELKLLEESELRETLERKVESLTEKISGLGTQLVESRRETVAAGERALAAENKFRTVRDLFRDA